jgi:ABC-type bacteriocin/lantibiotic exporter with double-glycine peptidase domain
MLALLGLNKIWLYVALVCMVLAMIAGVYLSGRAAGNSAAKTKQLSDALKNLSLETKKRAAVEAMKSSDARAQLKKKWSKR